MRSMCGACAVHVLSSAYAVGGQCVSATSKHLIQVASPESLVILSMLLSILDE